jgi:hypothetical protein
MWPGGGPEPKRIKTWGAIRLWSVVTAALGYYVMVFVALFAAGFVLPSDNNVETIFNKPEAIITIFSRMGS